MALHLRLTRLMKTTARVLFPVVAIAIAAACSSSSMTSPGATNPQPPGGCQNAGAHCSSNSDCCSQFCANGVCVRQQS